MVKHSKAEIAYHEGMKEFRVAAAAFAKVQEDYRARIIGDLEYIDGRKEYEKVCAMVDALEAAID